MYVERRPFFFLFFFIFFFFGVNQDIPDFAQTNPRSGWQGLSKRPAADEERGRTPNLVSDESAPNRSSKTFLITHNLYLNKKKKKEG
jgi:hypothetical protein